MIRVRPAVLDDLEAIRAVAVRNGLFAFDLQEARRSRLSHPFREDFEGIPIGWVLEKDGKEIVGNFTNVHMMYELDGRRVRAGVSGSWGVDVAHRNSSLLLAAAYFGQKGVDVCVNGSASAVAARLMPALKAQRIPSPGYDLSYFWITDRQAFAEAALRKKKIPAAGLLAPVAAAGLWARDLGRGGTRKKPPGVKRFSEFGPEFAAFWEKLRQGPGRLRAVRTPEALAWHFGAAMRENRCIVLGMLNGGELRGYAVLREFVRQHLGLRQFVIDDIQALDDSEDILHDLIVAALDATRESGMAALEWQGWNPAKRAVALRLRPQPYRYPVWPLFYRVVNAELAPILAKPDCWDFSPFDAF